MTHLRKVFLPSGAGGGTTGYWDNEWSSVDLTAEERNNRSQPGVLMRLLNDHVPRNGRILEAGCGASTYSAALRTPEREMFGVDLAQRTLGRVHTTWPDMHLATGDVREMPFRSGTFDCVISLGVVEHMEEGPDQSLQEHARILAPGAVLLISVPWLSAVKSVKDLWWFGIRRRQRYEARRRVITTVKHPGLGTLSMPFHQYEYSTSAWHQALEAAGLQPISDHRYLVSAGIGELPARLRRGVSTSPRRPATSNEPNVAGASGLSNRLAAKARRVLVAEDPSSGFQTAATATSQHLMAHMILTAARRTS